MSQMLRAPTLISPDDLQIGDILLTTAKSVTSVIIQIGSGGPVSHALLYSGGSMVIEAVPGGGVQEVPLSEVVGHSDKVIVLRREGLTTGQGMAVIERARRYVTEERSYDLLGAVGSVAYQLDRYIACPLMGLDDCSAQAHRWNAGLFDDEGFFCSELVAKAFEEVGMPLTDSPPTGVSPATLLRLALKGYLQYVGHLVHEPAQMSFEPMAMS